MSSKILGPQKDEAAGPGRGFVMSGLMIRSLLLAIYYLGDQTKEEKVGRVCSMYGKTNVYRVLAGEPKGKKALESSRLRWEANIKTGSEGVDWILTQDR